jgi:hypothetical protein
MGRAAERQEVRTMARFKIPFVCLGLAASTLFLGCAGADKRSCMQGVGQGCLEVVERWIADPPVESDQLMFFANLCDGGRVEGCASLALLCSANNDVECARTALEIGCNLGSSELCELAKELNPEPVADCSTEPACLETLKLQEEKLLANRSPENQMAYFETVDTLCHSFRRGDACHHSAEILKTTGGAPEKIIEHVVLACQYGNINSCMMLDAAVTNAKSAEYKNRCFAHEDANACYKYAMEILSGEPVQAKVLLKWVCEDKKHPDACRECKSLQLGCKSKNPAVPASHMPKI